MRESLKNNSPQIERFSFPVTKGYYYEYWPWHKKNERFKKIGPVTKEQWLQKIDQKAHTCGIYCKKTIEGWNPDWGDLHEEYDRYCTKLYGPVDINDLSTKEMFRRHELLGGKICFGYSVNKNKRFYTKRPKPPYFPDEEQAKKYLTYSSIFDNLPIHTETYDSLPRSLFIGIPSANHWTETLCIGIAIVYGFLIILPWIKNMSFVCDWWADDVLNFVHSDMPFALNAILMILGAILIDVFSLGVVFLGGYLIICTLPKILEWVIGRRFILWPEIVYYKAFQRQNASYYKGKYIEGTDILRATIPRNEDVQGAEGVVISEPQQNQSDFILPTQIKEKVETEGEEKPSMGFSRYFP